MPSLKLGTRRSLLAKTQSQWVADQIIAKNPNLEIELVEIVTTGDKDQVTPLGQMAEQNVFSKELDDALLEKRIDFAVHSMKDLSLQRPKEFKVAAIPPRENPRDIVLFHPRVIDKIKNHQEIRIGTSSPRRLELVPPFLKEALPRFSIQDPPRLKMTEIRGNVNTRIKKLDDEIDGVVLALAGLIRLWRNEESQKEIKKLLRGLKRMILPLSLCPTAPAQGALAVECLAERGDVVDILNSIHHEPTENLIRSEKTILSENGGGCHQRFGATVEHYPKLGDVMIVRGKSLRGQVLDELKWPKPKKVLPADESQEINVWDGTQRRLQSKKIKSFFQKKVRGPVFITHSRAIENSDLVSPESNCWTPGYRSWFQIAKKGLWVEGCGEGFGFDSIQELVAEPFLNLPNVREWTVVTHQEAQESWLKDGWNKKSIVVTYQVLKPADKDQENQQIKQATHVFWGSFSQFSAYSDLVAKGAHHACGPGKTASQLNDAGLKDLTVFPNAEEWRKWIYAD